MRYQTSREEQASWEGVSWESSEGGSAEVEDVERLPKCGDKEGSVCAKQ